MVKYTTHARLKIVFHHLKYKLHWRISWRG